MGKSAFFKNIVILVVSLMVFNPFVSHAQLGDWLGGLQKKYEDVKGSINKTIDGLGNQDKSNNSAASADQKDSEKDYNTIEKMIAGTGTIASIAGSAYCAHGAQKNRNELLGRLCSLGIIAGPVLSAVLGKVFTEKLKEHDQRKALEAVRESLHTGQPKTIELPDSKMVFTVSPEDQPIYVEEEFEIKIDKKTVSDLNKLQAVGMVYQTANPVIVSARPIDGSGTNRNLESGEKVFVMGEDPVNKWMMVAFGIEQKDAYEHIGVGYVPRNSLNPNPIYDHDAEADTWIEPPPTIASVKIPFVQVCRKMLADARGDDGTVEKSTSHTCTTPSGKLKNLEPPIN